MHKYDIIDIDKFVDTSRTLVYQNFGQDNTTSIDNLFTTLTDEELSEMNSYLTLSECKIMLSKFSKKQKHKHTKIIKYIITEQDFIDYIDALNNRLISNMLAKLASEGFLETAFDEETNDFVFWVKDNHEKN